MPDYDALLEKGVAYAYLVGILITYFLMVRESVDGKPGAVPILEVLDKVNKEWDAFKAAQDRRNAAWEARDAAREAARGAQPV